VCESYFGCIIAHTEYNASACYKSKNVHKICQKIKTCSLIPGRGLCAPPGNILLMGIIGKGKMCRIWISLLTGDPDVPRMFNMQISAPLCKNIVLIIPLLILKIFDCKWCLDPCFDGQRCQKRYSYCIQMIILIFEYAN